MLVAGLLWGMAATVAVIGLGWCITSAISHDKKLAEARARNDGYSDGYVTGEVAERNRWGKRAISLGFAFCDPTTGEFTWKKGTVVEPAPVDKTACAKAE